MITVSVMYPKTDSSTFDMDYYLQKHMKLVHQRWDPMGLRNARVLSGQKGPDGAEPPFAVMAILDFESLEAFGKAAGEHGPELFGDIPNFTNVQPQLQISEIVG